MPGRRHINENGEVEWLPMMGNLPPYSDPAESQLEQLRQEGERQIAQLRLTREEVARLRVAAEQQLGNANVQELSRLRQEVEWYKVRVAELRRQLPEPDDPRDWTSDWLKDPSWAVQRAGRPVALDSTTECWISGPQQVAPTRLERIQDFLDRPIVQLGFFVVGGAGMILASVIHP